MTDLSDPILLRLDDGVATLTLNRPHVLNAMTGDMMTALRETLQRVGGDDAVRCLILTGAGRGFCAGGDLTWKQADIAADAARPPEQRVRPQTFAGKVERLRGFVESARLIYAMPKPVIAMINGPCAGAGLALAGACDFRIASDKAVFHSAFVRAGLSGDYGGGWFWSRILGSAKARELYMLSPRLSAEDANRIGMLTDLVSADRLEARTLDLARDLSKFPEHALRLMKDNFRCAAQLGLDDYLDAETRNMVVSGDQASAQGGRSPAE